MINYLAVVEGGILRAVLMEKDTMVVDITEAVEIIDLDNHISPEKEDYEQAKAMIDSPWWPKLRKLGWAEDVEYIVRYWEDDHEDQR